MNGRWWLPEVLATLIVIALVTFGYIALSSGGPPAARGLIGHGLGVAGVALMLVAQFAYTWRKRPGRHGPGPTYRWLQVHAFAGMVGPYLALLHTAFRFKGMAGILMLVVVMVMLSGMVGRYLYTREPAATASAPSGTRPLAGWYRLHVPLTGVLFLLAIVHAIAAIHYAWRLG